LLPAETGTYLGLEAAAEHVRGYAGHVVPALIQTSAYAEAFFKVTRPELGRPKLTAWSRFSSIASTRTWMAERLT
jgi:hypothetical protein